MPPAIRRERDAQALDLVNLAADLFGQADNHRKAAVALKHLARFLAADGNGHDILNVTYIEAQARQSGAIGRDLQHRQASHLLDTDIRRPVYLADNLLDRLSNAKQFVEIVAKYLDRDIGANPRQSSLKRIWIGWVNS